MIKDHEGNELGNNKVGTLWVHGETYPTCYLNNEKATEERFVDGWFNTHDLFYKNEDGFFYHQGRLNDLIYKNGVWIFPARIEGRINAHNNVRESIVIDYRAEANETNLVAFLVINGNIETNDLYRDVIDIK